MTPMADLAHASAAPHFAQEEGRWPFQIVMGQVDEFAKPAYVHPS